MTWASPEAALQWVKARWSEFVGLDRELLDLQHRAAVVAAETDDPETDALATAAVERIGDLRALHAEAVRRMDVLSAAIPGLGLGAIVVPVIYAGAAVAAAGLVALIFARAGAERRIVDLLEAGQLTTDEASALLAEAEGGGGLDLFGSLQWVAVGIAGLVVWQYLRDRERG